EAGALAGVAEDGANGVGALLAGDFTDRRFRAVAAGLLLFRSDDAAADGAANELALHPESRHIHRPILKAHRQAKRAGIGAVGLEAIKCEIEAAAHGRR